MPGAGGGAPGGCGAEQSAEAHGGRSPRVCLVLSPRRAADVPVVETRDQPLRNSWGRGSHCGLGDPGVGPHRVSGSHRPLLCFGFIGV